MKAIGFANIRSDTIIFRAGDKVWEFPAYDVLGHHGKNIATYNGCYYEASVRRLNKLAKEKKNG